MGLIISLDAEVFDREFGGDAQKCIALRKDMF